MSTQLTVAQAIQVLADASKTESARVTLQQTNPGDDVRAMVIDLSTARAALDPLALGSFKTLWVTSALNANGVADPTVTVNIRINSKLQNISSFALSQNQVLSQDFPFSNAYLDWAAQASCKITIVIFAHANFQSGSLQTQISGGVTPYFGSTVTTAALGSVTTTAAQLFAADVTRKKMEVWNTGTDFVYLGDSNVDSGATNGGIPLAPGAVYSWESAAACFAVAKSGTQKVSFIKFS